MSAQNRTDNRLCSSCGLCMISDWPKEETLGSCVFNTGWLGQHEVDLYGRERNADDHDEITFGISRKRVAGCIKNPLPGVAWSGVITSIAKKAIESGLVGAVATLHRDQHQHFKPVPVLARSVEDVLASSGNKPVVAPVLLSLHEACRQGVKKLLVIGAPCHIHALRHFKKHVSYLSDMEVHTVGIPCVSNVHLKTLGDIMNMFSTSPETVRHYEFMQDYTVHLKHANGRIERLPYFSIPREFTGTNLVMPACMCCLDYINGLADVTVGYIGAPLDMKKMYQWIIMRTEKGEHLMECIAPELDTTPLGGAGETHKAVTNAAKKLVDQITGKTPGETGRSMPIWAGKIMAALISKIGPRGEEFARYSLDLHQIRDYYYTKTYYQEKIDALVPGHVYRLLEKYGFER